MPSAPPLDPAIVSSERPTAVYSRAQLLALYSSPLVPNKLDGMKELSEWHGEVLPPPSPPQSRSSLNSRTPHGDRANSERSSRRLHAADSSPFANFGRFGVDGGLTGDADAASARNRRAKGAFAALSSDNDKDTAPHLLGRDRERSGAASSSLHSERDRGDRLRSRNGHDDTPRRNNGEGGGRGGELEPGRRRGAGASSLEALEAQTKRDTRRGLGPADEGGWRNVGMTREEREKRLTARNSNHSSSTTDSPASRREGGAFGARTGRPAWMDDEASDKQGSGGSSSPAWMDAPATGKMSFDADGKARSSPEETSREKKRDANSNPNRHRELETYNPATSGGAGANGGMDGMQLFKAQMKEREKRDRERELRAMGLPIESDEQASSNRAEEQSATAPAPTKSIFEDLGIARAPPGLGSPSLAAREPTGEATEQGRGSGGRSSRFAKFFDGKPVLSPSEAPADTPAAASIFGSLMGAAGESAHGGQSNAPSKEDADSMARLLGMLQVSGKRGSSPNVATRGFEGSAAMAPLPPAPAATLAEHSNSQPPSTPSSELPAPPATSRGEEEGGRSKSRFKFSNPPAAMAAVASTMPPPGLPSQPPSAGLQSPFAAGSPLPPPPSAPPGLASPIRSRAPTDATASSSNGGLLQSPRSARPPQNSMSPAPPGPPGSSFSPPPPLPGLAHPQAPHPNQQQPPPFFGHGPGGPSPQPPFPNAPDGRFLPHQMPLPGPGPNQQQLPPNMMPPPPFGFLPPFGAGNHPNNMPPPPRSMPPGGGPLSPPLASPPVGGPGRGPPSQFPFPGHGPPPPMPPPHLMFPPPPPPHFNPGHMPLPPPNPNQPSPLMNLGGNAGADLMALLNSGAGGQRIGANGPPNGVQVRQG
ncbi:hypothetical protein JCM10908_002483 [Rhodotorula pacifica]|uniref:uncharacterized protein n=1 Tax=Rhodotorula pacifica TaxID=1495444 RepID=UPI0031813056